MYRNKIGHEYDQAGCAELNLEILGRLVNDESLRVAMILDDSRKGYFDGIFKLDEDNGEAIVSNGA